MYMYYLKIIDGLHKNKAIIVLKLNIQFTLHLFNIQWLQNVISLY